MGADILFNVSLTPGVRALIPLLYAAWADRTLTVAEVHALRKQAADLEFLTESDRQQLLRWSDPAVTPNRELFQLWEIETKRAAARWHADGLPRLADLGISLAREVASPEEQSAWQQGSRRAALLELEERLGTIERSVLLSLFPQLDEDEQLAHDQDDASFSAAELEAFLDGKHRDTKQELRQLLTSPAFRRVTPRIKEEYREEVLAWCTHLGKTGKGAIAFPAQYGGKDDMGAYGAIFEMLAYFDLSLTIKFGVQFGLFGGAVANLGTQKHHDRLLKDIGALALPGCFAMTETGHGSNVRGLETTAVYDPATDEIIVHTPNREAGKEYIGNALHGEMAAVFAQLIVGGENKGVHAVLVPLRSPDGYVLPGIRVEDNGYKLGLNGVDNGRIWFDRVRVPRWNLLDRFGGIDDNGQYYSSIENPSRRFFTMLGTLVGGRVCVPRAGLSAAKSALAIAIKYALRRRQFSPTPMDAETIIMDYPSHQRRLFPLLAKAYALHFGLDYLLDLYVDREQGDIRKIETLAAGMKSYATWYTTQTIQECREACGGKGYLAENRFADLKADTDIFTTFEGDNTVLLQLVAKGLLSDFQKEFNEEGNLAVLRYLGRRLGTVVTEQNPVVIRQTDREHLEDTDWYYGAIHFRQRRLISSLAQRLRKLIKSGETAYSAALQCQTHMIAAAEAYMEKVVVKSFIEATKTAPESLRPILGKLRALYALSTIENHAAWYLEHDYISGNKSKAVSRTIDALCGELRPETGALIAAFGIPDALLGAPIALKH
jgi:acyl-CoA oxidase